MILRRDFLFLSFFLVFDSVLDWIGNFLDISKPIWAVRVFHSEMRETKASDWDILRLASKIKLSSTYIFSVYSLAGTFDLWTLEFYQKRIFDHELG